MTDEKRKIFEAERKKAKNDHDNSVGLYKFRFTEMKEVEHNFFQLKIALSGFIATIFTLLFSDSDIFKSYTNVFKLGFLILLILVILLIIEELWSNAKNAQSNLERQQKDTILTNIRAHSVISPDDTNFTKFKTLGISAENIYNSGVGILQDMKSGLSVEQIIEKRISKIYWRLRIFLWVCIGLMVPVLFFYELYLSK